MPNREEHLDIGCAAAILGLAILVSEEGQLPPIAELLGSGLGILGGAVLPDLIEPADTPDHRKTGHSVLSLGGSLKLGFDPPEDLTEWRQEIREAADQKHQKRQSLPPSHPDRQALWMDEQAQRMAVGFTKGLPIGYASHLIADSQTPGQLPPV